MVNLINDLLKRFEGEIVISNDEMSNNLKKTINILNENNYSSDDCILILRTMLIKAKRLLKLKKEVENSKNIDQIISLFRPLIFWKEKEIVKQQILNCSGEEIEKLIYQINEIEIISFNAFI